jgi:hypothetical protein
LACRTSTRVAESQARIWTTFYQTEQLDYFLSGHIDAATHQLAVPFDLSRHRRAVP